MKSILRLIGRAIESLAGALGGMIVAMVCIATAYFFYDSGRIGLAVLVSIGLASLTLLPVAGMILKRYFIPYTEPLANLLAVGEIVDGESEFAESITILAYCLGLVLVAVGSLFHYPVVLTIGLLIFVGYGLSAPAIFKLKLEGDSQPETESISNTN